MTRPGHQRGHETREAVTALIAVLSEATKVGG